MARYLAITINLFGLTLLFDAIYDQSRGVAEVMPVNGGGVTSYQPETETVAREDDPKRFRELMGYQWGRALVVLLFGYGVSRIHHDGERSDPFSPEFTGSAAIDDLERSLSDLEDKEDKP